MRLIRMLIAIAAVLGLVGCGAPQSAADPTGADAYPTMPPDRVSGPFLVTKVTDGDTISVERDGYRETIRLIGIDTPELNDPREGVECFANEAAAQAKTVLGGQSVYLESDSSQAPVDKYGRSLGYVWTQSGRLFNLDMIADGFANEYTYSAPYHYQQLFRAAEDTARSSGRGLWSPSACP